MITMFGCTSDGTAAATFASTFSVKLPLAQFSCRTRSATFQCFQELHRLRFQMCLVKVQETLDRIGPIQSTLTGVKSELAWWTWWTTTLAGSVGSSTRFKAGSSFSMKARSSPRQGRVATDQTWDADQVEPREVVHRPQNPADGQVRRLEVFQAADVSLGRPRLRRSVAETNSPRTLSATATRRANSSRGNRRRRIFLFDCLSIRLPMPLWVLRPWIGVPGGLRQPVGGDRTSVRQPMVQEDLEHDE